MSKDFKSHSATAENSIKAGFDLDTGEGYFAQDVSDFKKHAKLERERESMAARRPDGYRKFATIPDSIALKILMDHGLDLHDPMFMHDKDKVAKFKKIFMEEYRDLIVNT